jgi:hypothetical protein
MLGVLTGVLSAVPAIGTAIVFVPVSASLMITGALWKGRSDSLWFGRGLCRSGTLGRRNGDLARVGGGCIRGQ